jgi:hypothetical protein
METIDKPESHTRELTKTEIDIAVAQIADRLKRFFAFYNAALNAFEDTAREFYDPDSTTEEELMELKANQAWNTELKGLSEEYQVPIETVVVVDGFIDERHFKGTVSKARRWVKGQMSPEELTTMWEEAVDLYHYNIGWVLMESPSFGRHQDEKGSDESVFLKFMEIGCRNHSGSKLIDVSGPRNTLIACHEIQWNQGRLPKS